MKYKRFIDAIGGWASFQRILGALQATAVDTAPRLRTSDTLGLEQPATAS